MKKPRRVVVKVKRPRAVSTVKTSLALDDLYLAEYERALGEYERWALELRLVDWDEPDARERYAEFAIMADQARAAAERAGQELDEYDMVTDVLYAAGLESLLRDVRQHRAAHINGGPWKLELDHLEDGSASFFCTHCGWQSLQAKAA